MKVEGSISVIHGTKVVKFFFSTPEEKVVLGERRDFMTSRCYPRMGTNIAVSMVNSGKLVFSAFDTKETDAFYYNPPPRRSFLLYILPSTL